MAVLCAAIEATQRVAAVQMIGASEPDVNGCLGFGC